MPIEEARAIDSSRRRELKAQVEALRIDSSGPLTLEIGCGHGHFLTAYAEAHPDEFCLGVDIIEDRLVRAERKRQRAGLDNVGFLRAEARMLLEIMPETFRFDRVFVLFPDPWPKRKHHKNRLITSGFLHLLAEKSNDGVELCFRTDHDPYFKASLAIVESHSAWQTVETPWPFECETVFQERAEAYQSWVAVRR